NSSIILRPGSEINVNGGSVNYAGGYLNTSQLQLGNSLVDVGSAKSGVAYTAVVTPPDSPANYVAGYTQGGSAGTVLLSSPILVMEGNLSGQVTRGPYQRDPSASNFPQGGTLQIGTQAGPWYGTFYTTASEFLPDGLVQLTSLNGAVPDAPAVGQSFNLNDAGQAQLASALQIDTAALNKAGFSNLAVTTTGNIQVNQAVNLAPGGGLSLTALTRPQRYADETGKQLPLGGQIDVTNSITVPSGKITLDAAAAANGPAGGATVTVAKGVVLSTAGTWTNDQVTASGGAATAGTPTSTVAVNGGSVTIAGELIQLGNDVTIDASAGAWRNQQGNTRLGSAGTITLQALPVDNLAADVQASGLTLGTGVSLLAYGFLNGGTLNLSTQSLLLGDVGGAQIGAGTLNLGSAFFQQGGFGNYNLTAEESITLAAGAKVEPQQSNIALKPGVANMASSAMAKVDSVVTYGLSGANITRAATNLSLDAIGTNITSPAPVPPPASLSFQAGSTLTLDPGANLTIISGGAMDFESAINAPAGNVLISSQPSGANAPLLWFGSASSILVNGSAARLYTQPNGISTGNVLNAGSIRIGGPLTTYAGVQTLAPASGPVIMQAGAVFSAAGAGAGSQTLRNSNGEPVAQSNLGSNGGNIEIRSSSELQLAGAFNGTAGAGSQNGSLTLDLENTSGTFNVRQKYGTDGDESLATLASQTFSSFKATNGLGVVLTDNIDAGNFGQVYLRSQNALAFGLGNGNLTLSATKSVILDAPTLLSDSKALASDQAALLQAAMSTIEAQNSASHTVQTAAQVAAEAATLAAQNLPTSNVLLTTPATLTVDAPYVRLGDSSSSQTYYPAGGLASNANRPALAGNATLAVTAGTIDLLGNFATQGFSTTRLSATNDVRLVGVVEQDAKGNDTGYQNGSLWTLGTLQITSAQTYPTTLTDYLLVAGTAIDPNSTNNSILAGSGTVSFGPSGATPGPVPSAGGSLTVYATHIVQAGNLQAPFGEITLGNINSAVDANITNDLTYSAGSLTSVAGQGGIPFGIVANGSVPTASVWTATLNDGNSVTITQTPVSTPSNPERYLPTKAIVSQAANINVAKDATVDLAGGGSMFAYEFTPGKGGSTDVLNNNTTFAIMPAYSSKVAGTNNVAPVDSSNNNYGGQGGLQAGDSVWLSGMGNLPAGYYTLLPAHFALLPGAYAITAVSGTANMQATANAVE
ncbi:MAG: hypothetical protein JO370_04605, partial [Paucibacter sp.]|nr:hypothetical protein [Roseateles sp.]